MIILVSLLVCLAGFALHLIGGKLAQVGIVMFGCGLLVFLLSMGGHAVKLI